MLPKINRLFKHHPKIAFATTIFVLIGIEAMFSFCSNKCPGFVDVNFDRWFPYSEGQNVYFISDLNKRDTLRNLKIYKSQPYTSKGFEAKGCDEPSASIEAYDSTGGFSVRYIINNPPIVLGLKKFQMYFYGDIKDSGFIASTYNSTYSEMMKISIKTYQQFTFNGITYKQAQLIQKDTSAALKYNSIYKIWLAKDAGIIGYETYPTRERWYKQ